MSNNLEKSINRKQIFVSICVLGLLFYVIFLCHYLIPFFAQNFLLSSNDFPQVNVLIICSYLLGPIGAFIFGALGDGNYGRKNTLTLSLFLLFTAVCLLSILPIYLHIGIISTVLFVFLCFLIHIAFWGGLTGLFVFTMEIFTARKGFIIGVLSSAVTLGIIIAYIVSLVVFKYANVAPSILWRLPFAITTLLGYALMFYISLYLPIEELPKTRKKHYKEE